MQLQLETTAHCNARCVFCPHPNLKRAKGTMSMELFRKIIDEAADIERLSEVCLTGLGEPLLDPHLLERIRYVRSKVNPRVMVTFYTNGHMLTHEKSQQFADVGVTVMYVSLNATNARRRKEVTGLDDFDQVVENIRFAQSVFKPPTRVIAKGLTTKDLMEEGEPGMFLQQWGGAWNEGGEAFLHMEGNWAGLTWPARVKPQLLCTRAVIPVMVLWDGRVSLCCFDAEGQVILGDLNKQTIREVYASDKAYEIRKMHFDGRRGELPLCSQCTAI